MLSINLWKINQISEAVKFLKRQLFTTIFVVVKNETEIIFSGLNNINLWKWNSEIEFKAF